MSALALALNTAIQRAIFEKRVLYAIRVTVPPVKLGWLLPYTGGNAPIIRWRTDPSMDMDMDAGIRSYRTTRAGAPRCSCDRDADSDSESDLTRTRSRNEQNRDADTDAGADHDAPAPYRYSARHRPRWAQSHIDASGFGGAIITTTTRKAMSALPRSRRLLPLARYAWTHNDVVAAMRCDAHTMSHPRIRTYAWTLARALRFKDLPRAIDPERRNRRPMRCSLQDGLRWEGEQRDNAWNLTNDVGSVPDQPPASAIDNLSTRNKAKPKQ
ncbi:hypothetical protein MIND_00105700 [Mycena indigotica]|uniref:Uncharacterized protein n=1 Tax=Mycena indigotica TaxID=2126181 RepID=A0A8H6TEH1_9AGAR|nr:uncharacterized protein MIND_00105700 [Mycena indigotica]KAF7315891.1 hypothetical protein MIND_00105700 [Mycena indigotica]